MIKAWLHAARLRTLPLSVSGIIVGTGLAALLGAFDGLIFSLALLTTIGFQVLSNFANDLGDSQKGTDNAQRVGPARAIQSGQLTAAQMKKDALYFGDSTPVNMMHADQIHQLLPEARFINVIRDGRDVAVSVSKEPWGPDDPYEALSWWANRVYRSAVALRKVDPASVLHFRITDLIVNEREKTYADLLNFLKLEESEVLNQYFAEQVTPEKLHSGRWRTEVTDSGRFNAKYKALCKKLMSKGIEIKNAD